MIPITNDDIYEGPETFTVTLNYVSDAVFPIDPLSQYGNRRLRRLPITVTIIDDEAIPEVSFADSTLQVDEAAGSVTIRANLKNSSALDSSVTYTTSNLTATGGTESGGGNDYETQTNEELSFSAGDTNAEITIPIYQDSENEGNETFVVTLSNAEGVVFSGGSSTLTATITIVDDETPTVSVVDSSLSVSEQAGSTSIEFELSGPTSRDVAITYFTSITGDDTAEQDDFTAQSLTTATITSPGTTGLIEIPIHNDSDSENETFTLTLSGISGADFEGGSSIVVEVTIVDDEGLPILTVDSTPVTAIEGSSSAEIGLTIAPPPTGNVTVTYSTEGITASNDGTDYVVRTNANKTISSSGTGTIIIPIIDDVGYEPTETFNVKITEVTGAAFGANVREIPKLVTILDNEPNPVLSVQNTSVTASESGNAEIVVQVTNPSDNPITFRYSTTAGTATSADFTVQSSTLHTFGSGITDTILIPIASDQIDEIDEQFKVTFADLSGATFGNAGAPEVTVTIEDDDQAQISVARNASRYSSNYEYYENRSEGMEFIVNMSNKSSRDTSVTWTASTEFGDTATLGEDYGVVSNSHTGTVVISAGSTSATFRVPISDDKSNELTESFTITLSNPSGGAEILDGAAKGYIYDNDGEPTLTVSTIVSASEADGHIEIPLYLSATTYETVQVNYTTTAGTATGAGVDFETQTGRLHSIPAFSSSSSILIPIVNDELFEGTESFTVTLTNPTNAYFPGSAISQYSFSRLSRVEISVTIFDNDTEPVISLESTTSQINEGDGTLTIRANLSNASDFAASVSYSTKDLSASGGSGLDYEAQANQILNFPEGTTYAEINIPINQDNLNEGDETFSVTLSNPSNAIFADSQSTITQIVTILDDESPILSVDSSTLNVSESAGTANIGLMLSGPTDSLVEVTYSTSVESFDTASLSDFSAQSSATVVIVSPETAGVIAIPITNDSTDEDNETFTLTLSGIKGAVFSGGTNIVVKVTILDDEELPTLSVSSTSIDVSEESGSAEISLSLSATSTEDVTVTYSTDGATASNDGSDYTVQTNSTLSISAGSTTGTINIPIIDDGVLEGNEVFVVTLTEISGASFGPKINNLYVLVTIMDGQSQPALLVPFRNVSTFESGNALINVRLSSRSDSPVSFTYSTTPGTATSEDFTEQNSRLHTIGSGLMTTIRIPIIEDDIDEINETFTVSFADISGATFENAVAPTVRVTILDEDQSLFSIANSSRSEPSSGNGEMEFAVSLNNASSRDTSVTWTASTEEGNGAVLGTDYAVESNSQTGIAEIPAGSTSTSISIPITGNDVYEPNKENTFTITLTNPTGGAGIEDATAQGRIQDDEREPTISTSTTIRVSEADGAVTIPINLTNPTSEEITFYSRTTDGTATGNGTDFQSQTNLQHIIPPRTANPSIMIPITNDEIYEGPETFTVRLSSATNADIPCTYYRLTSYECRSTDSYYIDRYRSINITVTIVDDETIPEISFADKTPSVNESAGILTIRVNLNNATTESVSVDYSTSNLTATGGTGNGAGIDYISQTNETLNFSRGDTYAEIAIPINQDSLNEGNETFVVTLENPNNARFTGNAGTIQATATIVDDEVPILSVENLTPRISEKIGTANIELSLSGPTNGDVDVSYNTSIIAGTDSAQQLDFTEQSSETLTISTSETSGIIQIPINDDSGEEDDETFTLTLTNPTGAIFPNGASSIDVRITIVDDEGHPTITVTSTSIEVRETDSSVDIGLTLSAASDNDVIITYSTEGISASNDGTDYEVQTNETETISSGTTGTISIPLINDRKFEGTEKFNVNITSLSNATFEAGVGEISIPVTIIDDESPILSIANTNIQVSESGNAEIDLEVINPSEDVVSFVYSTTPGTANSADFTEQIATSMRIDPESDTSATIQIPITSDDIFETDETFTITFAELSGAAFAGGTAPIVIVTIEDNDQANLSISDANIYEVNSQTVDMTFSVRLSKESSRDTSVTWTASTLSRDNYHYDIATLGVDYAVEPNSHTGVVTIPAGSQSTTISMPIPDDTINEYHESFTVTLSNPTGGALISTRSAVGTIYDSDSSPYLSIPASISVNESDGNITIPIEFSNLTYEVVEVYHIFTSGTATSGIDFETGGGSRVSYSPYTNSASILIPIIDDDIYEGAETFTVSLSIYNNARVSSASNRTTITIIDDETIPEISFAETTPQGNESESSLTIGVNLSNASKQAVSVNYSTSNGTAIGGASSGGGVDYGTLTNQTLNFAPGETYAEITVPIYQDQINEGDQTFILTLSDVAGAIFTDLATSIIQTVTIEDDESPVLSIVSSTLNVSERAGTSAIELTLSGPTRDVVEVTYRTSIEGADTAVQADFITQPLNKISIPAAETTGIIAIPITNDTIDEDDETFTLTLTEVTGAVFSGGTSIVRQVTIVDDEGLPTLTVDSTSFEIVEGGGSVNIGLTLSADPNPASPVSVTYSTAGVTASNDGTDYTTRSNITLPISSGRTGTISIPIMDDTEIEGSETFVVKITEVSGAVFSLGVSEISILVTIRDNDTQPTILIPYTKVSTAEVGNAVIYVKLSNPSASPVSFTYSTTTGTATGADFTVQNSVLYNFGSELTDTIEIPITPDEIDEIDEQFTVTFASPSGATFGNSGAPSVAVTIQDDEQSYFSISDNTVHEQDYLRYIEFPVRLSKESSRNTSVTWTASTLSSDTATSGIDYAVDAGSHTGTAEIPAGSTSTTISIPIAGDNIPESTEYFTVTLSNPTGGAEISNGTARGTIYDDDGGSSYPTLSLITSVSGNEADGNIAIPLSFSSHSSEFIRLRYYTSEGTATDGGVDFEDQDYVTHYVPPFTSSSEILIPVNNDTLYEGSETFSVTIYDLDYADFPCRPEYSSSSYCYDRLYSITITVTINDDEVEPELSFADLTPSVNETDGTLTIRANLSHVSTQDASVEFSTSNGSATGWNCRCKWNRL